MNLPHLTLNTGYRVLLETDMVSAEAIRVLAPLVCAGGGEIPGVDGLTLRLNKAKTGRSALYSILIGHAPVVTCGFAADAGGAEELWPELERIYLTVRDEYPILGTSLQPMPDPPWLGVVLFPHLDLMFSGGSDLIGSLAECIAATLVRS